MSDTAIETQVLTTIEADWHKVSEIYRSFGVWIRRYAPLPITAYEVDYWSMPEVVWFLDDEGLRVENVWKWVRFVAMQGFVSIRFDAQRPTLQSVGDAGRRAFSIGLAAFAFYEDGKGCYSETQWGPRYGQGLRWTIKNGSLCERERLWVS